MEGQAIHFGKFAGIDCFDIEVTGFDPWKLADIGCASEAVFDAVNPEGIRAPDCFAVERICRDRMAAPAFRDDRRGTATRAAAAATDMLCVAAKSRGELKIVALGAGAAAIARVRTPIATGVKHDSITTLDRNGVVHAGRRDLGPQKAESERYAKMRITLDALAGANPFLGVSAPGLLTQEVVRRIRSSSRRPIPRPRACPRRRAPCPMR